MYIIRDMAWLGAWVVLFACVWLLVAGLVERKKRGKRGGWCYGRNAHGRYMFSAVLPCDGCLNTGMDYDMCLKLRWDLHFVDGMFLCKKCYEEYVDDCMDAAAEAYYEHSERCLSKFRKKP